MIVVLLTAACHKEEPQIEKPDPVPSTQAYELYEDVCDNLGNYVETYDRSGGYDALIRHAETIQGVDSTAVVDSVLYVYTKEGYKWFYDMYGITKTKAMDENDFDWEAFQQSIDSINVSLGVTREDLEGAESSETVFGSTTEDNNNIARSRAASKETVLTRRNVLFWYPWDEHKSYMEKVQNVIRQYVCGQGKLMQFTPENCTAGSFKIWNKYDFVCVICHGGENGEITIPRKYSNVVDSYKVFIKNKKAYKGFIEDHVLRLEREALDELLPKDLSHTVIWTDMCYANYATSAFRMSTASKGAANFVGATDLIISSIVLPFLIDFAPKFFSGVPLLKAFNNGVIHESYEFDYEDEYEDKDGNKVKESKKAKGRYGLYLTRPVRMEYLKTCPPAPKTGQPRTEHSGPIKTRGTKSVSINNVMSRSDDEPERGLYLLNTKTNEKTLRPYTKENVTSYTQTDYGDVLTRTIVESDFAGLEPETKYKYCAYVKIDGEIVLADYCYEFTTPATGKYIELTYNVSNSDIIHDADRLRGDDGFRIIGADYGKGNGIENLSSMHTHGHTVKIYYDGVLTEIGESAFEGCDFSSIVIPNTVTTIGAEAFAGCGIDSIVLPNSLRSLGEAAFRECGFLTSITIQGNITTLPPSLFWYCKNLTSVNLPEEITEIGSSTFGFCEKLTSIRIPSNVTTIGSSAFDMCQNLTSITIPGKVTELGESAFYGCRDLTSVEFLGNGITDIKRVTFYRCYSLVDFVIPDGVKNIAGTAFDDCKSLTSITIPSSMTYIVSGFLFGCDNLTSIKCLPMSPPTPAGYGCPIRNNANIYVPANALETYKTHWWDKRDNIFPL